MIRWQIRGRSMTDDDKVLISEVQMLLLCMQADSDKSKIVRREIAEIVMAWWRGNFAPRSAAPILSSIFERGRKLGR